MTPTFDNPAAMLWLIAAAAIAGLGTCAAIWRRRAAARFADAPLLPRIAPGLSTARGVWRAVLLGGAAACLAVALMDPRAAEQSEEVTRRGADVMFVVDVSRSMLAEDATPNRLERAKAFISDAIDAMGGDRIGLIDFAGVAAVRAPLTLNYDALKAAVDDLEPKDSRRGGSMLGDAIRLAAESFPTDDAGHAIVVLSDGEDMGSDPLDAAKEAAERGIRIIAVGIGDPREGARIPVGDGATRRYLVHEGEEVWSRMDSATLRDVADSTGGLFVPAATAQVELGEILTRSLGDIERTEGDSTVVKTAAPLFQWPAALALALLVIESLIAARARRLGQSGSGASRPIMDAGMPATPPAPQRRRRSRPRPAPAVAAALAAVAAISAATTEALAQDRAEALPLTLTPPAAGARDSGSSAGEAPEDSASRTGAAKGPRLRRTGRGQIDRAAFRDAVSRANASMQSGQYVDAAAAFAEAMDADPTSAAAAYNRGVAEYRAGMLAESAASFAQAASLGDAKLAADAMFNQGNATYQGALRALPGAPRDAASAQPAALPPATNGTDGVPDLKAAAEAVSKALTHYKDSIAANPDDVDSRANAEIAHALLKRLEQMQQQQQQDDQEKDDSDEKDQQEQQDQSQGGQQCDNPKQGDGQEKAGQKKKGQSGGGSPSQSEPPDGEQPDDPTQEQKPEGERTDTRTDKPETSKEGSDSKKPDESDAGDDRYSPQDSAPDDDAPKQEKDSRSQDKKDQAGSKDELKARGDSGQDKSDQQPPAPAQARGGEPVPGAPLTKAEAERLLQGVRDRAKQRMEAKERADRVRQAPAVRDW